MVPGAEKGSADLGLCGAVPWVQLNCSQQQLSHLVLFWAVF